MDKPVSYATVPSFISVSVSLTKQSDGGCRVTLLLEDSFLIKQLPPATGTLSSLAVRTTSFG